MWSCAVLTISDPRAPETDVSGRTIVELLLRGTNLTDQEARNHVSFLKDLAPLPGRDVRLDVRLDF